MDRKVETGNEILLNAQFGDIKRVTQVLGVHEQMDLPVDRYGHFSRDNIVLGILIVGCVQAKEVGLNMPPSARLGQSPVPVKVWGLFFGPLPSAFSVSASCLARLISLLHLSTCAAH